MEMTEISKIDINGRGKIQKVSLLLLKEENNKEAYIPEVVSIGPYHHGNPDLALADSFKPTALNLFVSGGKQDHQFYYHKILEVIDQVRCCYQSTDAYSDHDLARMILLDASFLILRMETTTHDQGTKISSMAQHLGMLAMAVVVRDFFLLENQIPFFLVKLLVKLRYDRDDAEHFLNNFLNTTLLIREYTNSPAAAEPLHLLEALHRLVVSSDQEPTADKKYYLPNSFYSVTELKTKGVRFKPSPTQSLNVVTFKTRCNFYAKLHIPTWCVSTYTKVVFLNLIAYELNPNNPSKGEVTSYVNLMNSMIQTPEDVKELRENNVLKNMLGSDEQILQVYKDINTHGADNPQIFHDLREKIQAYCSSKMRRWISSNALELVTSCLRALSDDKK